MLRDLSSFFSGCFSTIKFIKEHLLGQRRIRLSFSILLTLQFNKKIKIFYEEENENDCNGCIWRI